MNNDLSPADARRRQRSRALLHAALITQLIIVAVAATI